MLVLLEWCKMLFALFYEWNAGLCVFFVSLFLWWVSLGFFQACKSLDFISLPVILHLHHENFIDAIRNARSTFSLFRLSLIFPLKVAIFCSASKTMRSRVVLVLFLFVKSAKIIRYTKCLRTSRQNKANLQTDRAGSLWNLYFCYQNQSF